MSSKYVGLYLVFVFLNAVIFVSNYDIDGLASKICNTKRKLILGYLSILFSIPLLIFLITPVRKKLHNKYDNL